MSAQTAPPPQAYPPQAAPPPQPVAPPPQAYPQQQVYPQAQPYPQQAYPQQYGQPQPYPPPVYAQPVYAGPPPAVYVTKPARPPRPPRAKKGLLIGGMVTLTVSYAIGLVSGAILVDTACCEEVGWDLFIPVAGPFMGLNEVENGKGALVMLGVIQLAGLGLTLGGIVQTVISSNRIAAGMGAQRAEERGLALKLREGRSMAFDVGTTPLLTGPTMKLRF
ncbi:MAG TPA: hypothetical protein VFZ61_26965 [Polyangiales bacterium]